MSNMDSKTNRVYQELLAHIRIYLTFLIHEQWNFFTLKVVLLVLLGKGTDNLEC